MLGGVTVPHHAGLKGHSDADALLHAIVDALLGAAGKADIGTRFPNSDPQWKDAESVVFLDAVWRELRGEGWQLVNVDCTVLAEEPKLKPFIPAMKEKIASILSVGVDRVGIKATTTEELGAIGRKEGLLASAVVLLQRSTTPPRA